MSDLLGLEGASAAEERARGELEQARTRLGLAESAYDRAKAIFVANPGDDTERDVNAAFAEKGSAELWLQARQAQHETATRAREVAEAFAASAERDRKLAERRALLPAIRVAIEGVARCYGQLGEAVATLEDLAEQETELAHELEQAPLTLELLRVACGVRLAQECESPTLPRLSTVNLRPLTQALDALQEPGNELELAYRMRTVLGEFAAAFGAELGDFIRLAPAPRRGDNSDFAESVRAAEDLLAQLREQDNGN